MYRQSQCIAQIASKSEVIDIVHNSKAFNPLPPRIQRRIFVLRLQDRIRLQGDRKSNPRRFSICQYEHLITRTGPFRLGCDEFVSRSRISVYLASSSLENQAVSNILLPVIPFRGLICCRSCPNQVDVIREEAKGKRGRHPCQEKHGTDSNVVGNRESKVMKIRRPSKPLAPMCGPEREGLLQSSIEQDVSKIYAVRQHHR